MTVQTEIAAPGEKTLFSSLDGLRSAKSTHRLNQIARIRANGVGDHISLPQLVVCGDQSAGKSSVLEGITGIPFPRQDGVCTKFATEIILHHDLERTRITATVIPHKSRGKAQRDQFQEYCRVLKDFSELPDVIRDAGALMQLRGQGVKDGPAFAEDVLRIEVVGRTGLHLTVVDLPGLIAVANEEQTEEDVQLVSRLVDTYLESSRTIILAVVQANNDIANQGIIQRAQKFDRAGERTVGIITKPDLINRGTEGRIAKLAKNRDTTKLKLGYFLLKNPSPEQLDQGITLSERMRQETNYFFSAPWKEHGLDPERVGIHALREFLQNLLDRHVERELPEVRKEIKALLTNTEAELSSLGDERPSVAHLRMFLTRRSMEFYSLVSAALEGNYYEKDGDFFNNPTTRLRAEVHQLNGDFASYMRENSQKWKLYNRRSSGVGAESDSESDQGDGQVLVSEQELNAWVKKTYMRTRGRELPGNYNYVLLSELFHEQSSRWQSIAEDHVTRVSEVATGFVQMALLRLIREENVRREISVLTSLGLDEGAQLAREELGKIVADEKLQPITYNHYYTDNIQKARQDSLKKSIQQVMRGVIDDDFNGKLHVSNTLPDMDRLLASLQKRVVVNMDDQACAEALAGLNAYYKVAMKTFVDNICRQVIERHILSALPDLFAPTKVMSLSDEDLVRIATEPEKQREHRATLATLVQGLRDSLLDLQK